MVQEFPAMRKNFIALITLAVTVTCILLMSQYFYRTPEPAPDSAAIETIFTLPVADFQPEPNERKLFILSALLTPILCAGLYFLLTRSRIPTSRWMKLFAQMLLLATPVLFYLMVYYSMKNTTFPFLALSSFIAHPGLTLASVLFLFFLLITFFLLEGKYPHLSKRISDTLYFSIGIALIGLISVETIHSDTEPIVFIRNSFEHLHFTAYFDALAQTYLGKSPVVLNPQYGYYPFFLNPLFKVVGLSVLSFTIVMSVFKLTAYMGLLVTLRKVTRNWLVALIGFTAMIFYTRIRVPIDVDPEPYFQYNPHRLFFPAILIFLVWLYMSRKTSSSRNFVYKLTTLAASISVLWNPDTGIIVFASWMIVLGYIELLDVREKGVKRTIQNIVRHAAGNFATLSVVILAFCLFAYIQNGTWPNLIKNFQYTSLFYNYGFYMLTLPRRLHPWMWVALPYIAGIYFSISHLLDANDRVPSPTSRDKSLDTSSVLVFAISIVGTGVFTYYQGRSHNYNLIAISWPAYLLYTIFTDRCLQTISRIIQRSTSFKIKSSLLLRYVHQALFFGIFFYFLGSSFASIAIHFPEYSELIGTRLGTVGQANQALIQQSEFIRETSTPQDTILILSDDATELYLYTGHQRPLDIPGFSELVMKADVNKLNEYLSHPPKGIKIYWDTSFRIADPRMYNNLTNTISSRNLILFEPIEP